MFEGCYGNVGLKLYKGEIMQINDKWVIVGCPYCYWRYDRKIREECQKCNGFGWVKISIDKIVEFKEYPVK